MLARTAGQEVARVLDVEVGSQIIIVRRLLKFAGKPVVIDEIYLRGDLFPGLNRSMCSRSTRVRSILFRNRFGVRMIRAEERLRAVAADRQSAEYLEVPENTPLLSVERVAIPTATSRSNGGADCVRPPITIT
jgi:GntR family transcriptional regulator